MLRGLKSSRQTPSLAPQGSNGPEGAAPWEARAAQRHRPNQRSDLILAAITGLIFLFPDSQ
jgi:hypothetical protein